MENPTLLEKLDLGARFYPAFKNGIGGDVLCAVVFAVLCVLLVKNARQKLGRKRRLRCSGPADATGPSLAQRGSTTGLAPRALRLPHREPPPSLRSGDYSRCERWLFVAREAPRIERARGIRRTVSWASRTPVRREAQIPRRVLATVYTATVWAMRTRLRPSDFAR